MMELVIAVLMAAGFVVAFVYIVSKTDGSAFFLIAGVLVLSLIFHPIFIVPLIYVVGIIFLFLKSNSSMKRVVWQKTFGYATLSIFIYYVVIFLAGHFIHICGKARQSEAKTNLASIATAQISYFAETGKFGEDFEIIGWSPTEYTKYSYYFSSKNEPKKVFRKVLPPIKWGKGRSSLILNYDHNPEREIPDIEKRALEAVESEYGIGLSENDFTAVALGNIDSEPCLDVWIINQMKVPINVYNDVNDSCSEIINLPEYKYYFFKIQRSKSGFTAEIYADRISFILVIVNGILWLLLYVRNENDENNKSTEER